MRRPLGQRNKLLNRSWQRGVSAVRALARSNEAMAQARQFRLSVTGSNFKSVCFYPRDQVIGVKLLKPTFYALLQLGRC